MLADVLGETSCPRHRLCSIRSILRSKSTCFHFRANASPNLAPVRGDTIEECTEIRWRRAQNIQQLSRRPNRFLLPVDCRFVVFRIGDRAIKSLSTASDKIACKTKSRLRTVFADSPLANFVCTNLSMCNGTISSMRVSPKTGKMCSRKRPKHGHASRPS